MADASAGFDGDDVVDLSFDFSKWKGPRKTDIPEPSTEQMAQFYTDLARLAQRQLDLGRAEPEVPEDETPEQRDVRLEGQLAEAQRVGLEMEHERSQIYAAVCSDTPTADELLALPHRVRRSFYGYLSRMLSPEA
jgi:hypothetical protein